MEERYKEIENSIITKYRKDIFKKFRQAIDEYELVKDGDKIAVCISGGKDSMLMAKCFQEFQKHGKAKFELVFLLMDPGYSDFTNNIISENSKLLNIPLTVFQSNIFDVVEKKGGDSACYLCAKMRRGFLYSKAEELGCNKIAIGHHFDDVIETTLLSMLYGGEFKTMMPKLHSDNYNLELIRPMYLIKEADIISWKKSNELDFINCACRFTQGCVIDDDTGVSKRKEMKKLVKKFRQISPYIETSIFNSTRNVNMNAILGYHKEGDKHSFLEEYDSIEKREEKLNKLKN
jgi:tRNA(Ile)-lysidine synthase TilS/MesJ